MTESFETRLKRTYALLPNVVESDRVRAVVQIALLKVAHSVARHIIEGDGWSEDDACFQLDLRAAEEEIVKACETVKKDE